MIRTVFTEFEAYAESIRDDAKRLTMPSVQVSQWSIRHADVGTIHIQNGIEGGGDIAEGNARGDGWAFYNQTRGT